MLQVLFLTLVTSTSSFTTHRYDAYDSVGNYRPSAPLLDNIFALEDSNGRRPVQTYEYVKGYDGVVISDVYGEPLVNSDGEHGRVDTPFSYENPYQWNRQVPRNRVESTEPAKIYNRFDNHNQDREYVNNPDTRNTELVVKYDKNEQETNQRNPTNELKPQGNFSVPSKQSNDVNHTLVINEQQITWHNDHQGSSEDNANINTRSINSANNSNTLNTPTNYNADKRNHQTKTNDDTASKNNRNEPTNTSIKYSTKTTQDNEITPRPYGSRTKGVDEDRWVWSNGKEQVVVTTTTTTARPPTGVDDRAAFSANECPNGQQKLGTICVMKD